MADYQFMYKRMFQETTRAIRILQAVQQECEELYISSSESEPTAFSGSAQGNKEADL